MDILMRSTQVATAATLVLASAVVGCSNGGDTIPVAEWVAEFNQRCAEIGAELSDPELSDAEFREISERGIAEMRAIGTPDDNAAEAATLLAVIESTTDDQTLDDEALTALDRQFLDAAIVLGISDDCIGGAQG